MRHRPAGKLSSSKSQPGISRRGALCVFLALSLCVGKRELMRAYRQSRVIASYGDYEVPAYPGKWNESRCAYSLSTSLGLHLENKTSFFRRHRHHVRRKNLVFCSKESQTDRGPDRCQALLRGSCGNSGFFSLSLSLRNSCRRSCVVRCAMKVGRVVSHAVRLEALAIRHSW